MTMNSKKSNEERINDLKDHKFFSAIIVKASILRNECLKNEIYDIIEELDKNPINLDKISDHTSSDVFASQPSLRSLVWKISLNYLPRNIENWEMFLDKKRDEYSVLKEDYITSKNIKKKITPKIDILSDKYMITFYKETKILELIEKDIKRTYNELNFFHSPSRNNKKETNKEVIKRLLFIFAKKHPEISYVQGLNVIMANLFFVFSQDQNPYFNLYAEEDTFFCFELLINSFKEIYMPEKDRSDFGIKNKIDYIKFLIFLIDAELFFHLINLKIDIYIFLFKWYTLFFSQDFPIDITLIIWDHFLTYESKEEYLTYLCVSAIMIKKKELLNEDAGIVLNALQNFNDKDEELIIEKVPKVQNDVVEHANMITQNKFDDFVSNYCK